MEIVDKPSRSLKVEPAQMEWRTVEDPQGLVGWELHAVLYKDVSNACADSVIDPHATYSGCTTFVTKHMLESHPVFLMKRPLSNKLEELASKLDAETSALDECKQTISYLKKQLNEREQSHRDVVAVIKELESRFDESKKSGVKLLEKSALLEEHIGKIRNELGEARMREIIGEDSSTRSVHMTASGSIQVYGGTTGPRHNG